MSERSETVEFLQQLGLAVLPVAPAQDPYKYPRIVKADKKCGAHCPFSKQSLAQGLCEPDPLYTGKNPSYLDHNGKPHPINHREYQDRQSTASEHRKWFSNPANGLGCLGGNNGIHFIDLDRKHFATQEDCEREAGEILERTGPTWVEQTRSGGSRIAIRLSEPAGFTNFALKPGGQHVGELIGKGRFVVLAPTADYVCLDRREPVAVASIEAVIHPAKAEKTKILKPGKKLANSIFAPTGSIALSALLTDNARAVLSGEDIKGDRSGSLTLLIHEVFGWQNWGGENGVPISGSAEDLTYAAGESLGLDNNRIGRILKTSDTENCNPSGFYRGGDQSCWLKIRRLNRLIFDSACPPCLKTNIESAKNVVEPAVEQSKNAEDSDREFPLLVRERLYLDTQWICVTGKLYRRETTHYEHRSDDFELKRIQALAESVSYYCQKRKREVFPFAKPSAVKNALEWVKMKFAIDPELCNPDGLNCLNGVLTFDENDQPVLIPHSFEQYFLYKPTVAYTPSAASEDCDRLLAALRPEQLDVFLRTIAAIFDVKKTRLKVGRLRALLAIGTGSNGKDALRHAISTLLGGSGMSDVTLEDFADHDKGRKFNTARLRGSVVNWASENRPGINLDKSKTLMRSITGETLTYELKGRDSEDYKPKAIQVFNLNELPNIRAALEATQTRFAPLAFEKTFKVNPDISKGELQADTRLKEDPDFVAERVLPALLNRLVEAYQDLMRDGIDYSSCDRMLEEIQIHNSHLLEFANETGLEFDADSVLPIKDLWLRLESYYESTGVLTVNSDGSRVWEDPIRPGDLYVRGSNQIPNRFIALFPKCKKVPIGGNRYGLKGLRFAPAAEIPEQSELETETETENTPVNSTGQIVAVDSTAEPESATIARYTLAFKRADRQFPEGADDQAIVRLIEELKPQPLNLKRAIWKELPPEIEARISRILKRRPDLARSKAS